MGRRKNNELTSEQLRLLTGPAGQDKPSSEIHSREFFKRLAKQEEISRKEPTFSEVGIIEETIADRGKGGYQNGELSDRTIGIEGTGRRKGSVQDRAEVTEIEWKGIVPRFKNEGLEEIQEEQRTWERRSSSDLEPSEKIPIEKKSHKGIEAQFKKSWVNKQFADSRWIPPSHPWREHSWEPETEPEEPRVSPEPAWFSLNNGRGQNNILEVEDPILIMRLNLRKRCKHLLVEEWCGRCRGRSDRDLSMDQNEPSLSTAAKVAAQHHVSPAMVKRAENLAESLGPLSPESS